MVRSLGIPARVAVGFTPGLLQPDGTRSVLGRNAHAWPEVWFDQFGWVSFEPTPGRGAPGAESHTGVAPAQDESVPTPGELATGQVQTPMAAPETTLPPPLPPQPGVTEAQPAIQPFTVTGARRATRVGSGPRHPRRRRPPLPRRPRWCAAGAAATPTPRAAAEIEDLWDRAIGAVRGDRVPASIRRARRSSRPMRRRLGCRSPRGRLQSLAALATEATYASDEEVQQIVVPAIPGESGPRRWCRQVERIAADAMTTGGRLRRYFTVWR